jgi:mono/diheme cytochrome c family protein
MTEISDWRCVPALRRLVLAFFLLVPSAVFVAQQSRPPAASSAPRAFFDKNCVVCHNDQARTGGLSLSGKEIEQPGEHAELGEKVLMKLRTRQMPPPSRPRPDAAETKAVTSWLEASLDRAAAEHPYPGRVGAHRLNRTEYANAIRDMLGLEINAKTLLLPDEADEGFDNVAESLALSLLIWNDIFRLRVSSVVRRSAIPRLVPRQAPNYSR